MSVPDIRPGQAWGGRGPLAAVLAAGGRLIPAFKPGRGGVLFLALAAGLLAALPYLHGIGNSFIELDDPQCVTGNIHVLKGLTWEGVDWAMTTFQLGHWHPLTWLSHMVDVSLFGVAPWGHHMVSILLHALNAALLFVALFRLTGSPWPSVFVAALFGVHPLHVESVAWVTERRDVLAGLFFMLVLLAYERYARGGKTVRLLTVVLLLALGLAAKSMLMTMPFVLLLLDVWPLGRTTWIPPAGGGEWAPRPWGRLLLEKTPLVALSLASGVVAFLAQREAGAVVDLETIPPGMRVSNALVSYATHLGRTVWPSGLAVLYPYPLQGYSTWRILGSVLLLAALSWGVFSRVRRAPFLAVGWLWFLGMLVPVIGIVQAGPQAMADRHTYLPLVGVFIAVAWGVPRLLPAVRHRAVVLGGGACAAVVLLSAASCVQVGWWKDSETLFRRTLAVTSGNWLIENNLGYALLMGGKPGEAVPHFREALRLRPSFPEAYNNMGNALSVEGKQDEAIIQYREALRLRPDFPEAHNNLGDALLRQGKREEATVHLREAIRFRPDFPEGRNNLGHILAIQGITDEAIIHLREALHLRPDYPEAHNYLGNTLLSRGNLDEATIHYREALRLRANYPEAHYNLGNILVLRGNTDEAITHFRKSLSLQPDYPEARYNLGTILAGRGKSDEAIAHLREALRLRPDYPEAHNNLGTILAGQGQPEEAMIHFREALRLKPDYADAHCNLGKVLAARGNLDEAAVQYREALRIQPDLVKIRESLEALLGQLEPLDEARKRRGSAPSP